MSDVASPQPVVPVDALSLAARILRRESYGGRSAAGRRMGASRVRRPRSDELDSIAFFEAELFLISFQNGAGLLETPRASRDHSILEAFHNPGHARHHRDESSHALEEIRGLDKPPMMTSERLLPVSYDARLTYVHPFDV